MLPTLSVLDFVSFLQSCETKSGTESLGLRLMIYCATHLDPIHNWVLTLWDIIQTEHQPPPLPDEVCHLDQCGYRQRVPAHHKQEHTASVLCLPLDGDQLGVPLWDLRVEVGDTMLPVWRVYADM